MQCCFCSGRCFSGCAVQHRRCARHGPTQARAGTAAMPQAPAGRGGDAQSRMGTPTMWQARDGQPLFGEGAPLLPAAFS